MGFKWSVHPTLSMLILYFIVTQQLYAYSLLMLSLLIHEVGHIMTAALLKVKVRQLTLLPFGGQLTFMPASYARMLLITCAGPLATIICLMLAYHFQWQLFLYMQLIILLFNSLPVWPLDGGKIVFYSIKLVWPSFKYECYIEVSFIIAITFAVCAFVIQLPIFFQLSLVLLCVEGYQAFRARKYVEALQTATRISRN